MATKYDAILLYSDDIWNNDREQDFTQAKVIGKGKASESECETFFPCGLYYEKGTTDDLGYQCLSITAEDVDVQGTKMTVISVALRNAAGQKMTLQLPKDSRKFPVQFGGVTGNAVTFYIDGAETYRNSKGAKEKAKKFIEARIEKLRSCDSPFAAESMEMGMEEMASEFSVERINPTPVAGKADMKAESFGAEENLAVADVDIHDGMNIPAGTGSIIGQAVPETDFTPFGASAEDAPVPADPRVSPLNIGLHTPSDTPDLSAEYDFQNQAITTITATTEAEARETFAGNYDATKEEWKIVDVRKAENMGLSAEENLAIQDVEIWDGMVLPEGTGNIMGQMTPAADFTPFGVSAEQAADPMPNESAIIGQTSDGTPYTRFGYAAENLAVADVDIHDGMNIPAGSGAIVGQAIPETDFTPFGASAEGGIGEDEVDANIIIDKLNIVDDEGLVEVGNYFGISNDDSEELYDEILKAIKNSPSSYLTQLQVILDDEYEAESFGECPKCGKSDLVIQYYEGKGDFGCGMCGHQWFEDFGAEAFGGDLASLYDYNGIESVRVEAPLGHGVTENLGAEEMDAYGGLMGVAAAFAAGLAYRHWSKSKINGDDAPDSETPAEESDDAPQA